MFCNKCGTQIPDGQTVCPNCGTDNAQSAGNNGYQPYAQPQQQIIVTAPVQQSNGCATAGFVLSLIGLLLFSFTFIFPILGVILSIVGIVKASKVNGTGRGLAIAGLIIGIIAFIPGILFIMLFTGALHTAAMVFNSSASAMATAAMITL